MAPRVLARIVAKRKAGMEGDVPRKSSATPKGGVTDQSATRAVGMSSGTGTNDRHIFRRSAVRAA
jgi:hypothetical protein